MAKREFGERYADGEISDTQRTAIDHLVSGHCKTEVAALVGCDRVSIWRWFQEPAFLSAYRERQQEIHSGNAERLRGLAAKSIDVLERILETGTPANRLKAAALILKSVDLASIDQPKEPTDINQIEQQQSMNGLLAELGL